MNLSEIGKIARFFWDDIPQHYPFVKLDTFVVMPDHVHGIIIITENNQNPNETGCKLVEINHEIRNTPDIDWNAVVETRHALFLPPTPINLTPQFQSNPHSDQKNIGKKRFRNPGKNTLSSIIGSYKSVVTKNARKITSDYSWQSRFHDRIIRNNKELKRIRQYIIKNPLNWGN